MICTPGKLQLRILGPDHAQVLDLLGSHDITAGACPKRGSLIRVHIVKRSWISRCDTGSMPGRLCGDASREATASGKCFARLMGSAGLKSAAVRPVLARDERGC